MGNLNAQLDDTKINRVVGVFRVDGVNENRELMLKMCGQKKVARCNVFLRRERYT